MIRSMYPFWSAVIAALLAQCLKPIIYFGLHREWKFSLIKDSGGFPSSHSALVTALSLSVGLQERFSSTLFAVTLALAVIVVYDAANVRYYAGQNIRLTKQLARDVQEHLNTEFENPVYNIKLKDVLGHRWIEVFGGITLGCIVAMMIHYLL
ncbi:MAG: divergent PAP2 family protein [Solobacterium sp.]|nr:divergent PAP2 family protein [Solobacterium sp.]